jgi:hypothetical protein
LKRLGHRVIGVDSSSTLIEAARRADPGGDHHRANATKLPLESASCDLVIAFMTLQDVDELAAAISEMGPAEVVDGLSRLFFQGTRHAVVFTGVLVRRSCTENRLPREVPHVPTTWRDRHRRCSLADIACVQLFTDGSFSSAVATFPVCLSSQRLLRTRG